MALVPSYGMILGLAVLLGLVSGGSLTLCYTIGGLMAPEAVRTTAFGFFSGAALFGALSPDRRRTGGPRLAARHLLGGRGPLRRPGRGPLARLGARAPLPRRPSLELDSRHEVLSPLRPRAFAVLREGGAHAGCPYCHSDLKVCLNCRLHDPGANNQRAEPQAEWQTDKDKANFCEFFEFREVSPLTHPGMAGAQSDTRSARAAFDALFGKKK